MTEVGIVFHDGRVVATTTESWSLIDSGGEADIYLMRHRGREYIVKVFTPKQTMLAKPIERNAEMLRRLTRLRRKCGVTLPRSLVVRGLPVGFGSWGDRAVLVFNSIEGFKTIADMLNDEEESRRYLIEYSDAERSGFALDVLKALACLEYADIVHVDVTTMNTALGVYEGRRGAYLFDIEAAAIMSSVDYPLVVIPARDVNYMPVEILADLGLEIRTPDAGELPLVLDPTKLSPPYLSWIVWTPTWYGLQLVSYVYLAVSLFQGLPAMSAEYWREIIEREREAGYPGGWPPRAMVEAGYLEMAEYRELLRLWRRLGDTLVAMIYRFFVVDVAERRRLPSFTISSVLY